MNIVQVVKSVFLKQHKQSYCVKPQKVKIQADDKNDSEKLLSDLDALSCKNSYINKNETKLTSSNGNVCSNDTLKRYQEKFNMFIVDEVSKPPNASLDKNISNDVYCAQNIIEQKNNNNYSKVNLFHHLQKRLYSQEELNNAIAFLSDDERFIGSLPKSWLDGFKPYEIKQKTMQIDEIISDFALSVCSETFINKTQLAPHAKKLKNELEQLLNKNCEVDFYKKGTIGKIFKVKVDDENFALKVYHSDYPKIMSSAHGKTKEIANAVYLNKQLKPNQCSKFYFGKIAPDNKNDGYMFTKFVNEDKKQTKPQKRSIYKYSRFDLGDIETAGNMINGKIVDYGAISYNFQNKKQQLLAKQLYPLIEKGDIEALELFIEKNKDSREFIEIIDKATSKIRNRAQVPKSFIYIAKNYTQNHIEALRALGIDFSEIEKYNYSDVPSDFVDKITKLGFKIDKK